MIEKSMDDEDFQALIILQVIKSLSKSPVSKDKLPLAMFRS